MSRPDKTTPRKGRASGKDQPAGDKGLHDSIDELEYLIGDNNTDDMSEHKQSDIPVLEDVVDPDNFIESESDNEANPVPQLTNRGENPESISDEQIAELLENVEEKISGELSELVDILKDTIKDSIITELKTELKTGFRRPSDIDDDLNR